MSINAHQIAGQLQAEAEKSMQQKEAVQQLYYMMGQNAASAANQTEDATMQIRGREETSESAAVRLQSELESQQKIQHAKSTLDFDVLAIDLMQENRQLIQQRRQVSADLAEKKSVSLFENPFEALANAFTIPWDEQELQGIDTQLKGNLEAQNSINSNIQTYAETTNKTAEALTDASVLSLTKGIAANQQIRLAEAHNKALLTDAQGIEATMRATSNALGLRTQAYNILATEEQRNWMREQRTAELARMEEARADKTKRKELLLQDVEMVKEEIIRTTGKPSNLRDDEILSMLERDNPIVKTMRDRTAVRRIQGDVTFGEGPEERLNYINATGALPKTSGQEALYEANRMALGSPAVTEQKSKEGKAAAAQAAVKQQFIKWEENVGSGDKKNPLSLPAYSAFKTAQSITTNPAYSVVKDLVEGESTTAVPLDPQIVFDRLVTGLGKGLVRPADAERMMVDIAAVSRDVNMSVHKIYDYTGLHQTVAGVSLKVMRPMGNLGYDIVATKYGNQKINMLDPVQVRLALSKGVAFSLGGKLNLSGERAEGSEDFYPPLTMLGLYQDKNRVNKDGK